MPQFETTPSKVFRGSVDEVFSLRNEIPPGAILELKVYEKLDIISSASEAENETRTSAFGKYAFVGSGSEEFSREKQAEKAREDRLR